MAIGKGRSSRISLTGSGYWAVVSWLTGFALSQLTTPFSAWLTRYAPIIFGIFMAATALLVAARWAVRRRLMWTPRKPQGGKDFLRQSYWAAFSLLLGLVTPKLLVGSVARWAAPIALALLAFGFAESLAGWARRRLLMRSWSPWRGNPYPSLRPYEQREAAVFFGREEDVATLAARVDAGPSSTTRFIPVVGPSGCGKSSLVRAGFVPVITGRWSWLRLLRRRVLVADPIIAGPEPMSTLAHALTDGDTVKWSNLVTALKAEAAEILDAAGVGQDPPAPVALLRALSLRRGRSRALVLVLDQLEETAHSIGGPQAFMGLLQTAIRFDSRLVVVATIRSDLLEPFLDGPFADMFNSQLVLRPMSRIQLRAVITGPARAAGVELEDGLADAMLDDAQGADAVALLGFTLHHLWGAAKDGRITTDEYHAMMGTDNALSRHAERCIRQLGETKFSGLAEDEVRSLVLDAMLSAVGFGGSGPIRRRFATDELSARARTIVDFMASPEVRLLASDGQPVTFEVAHEVVLRRWPALTEHIMANQEVLLVRTRLEPQAHEWLRRDRDASLLLRGEELRATSNWPLLHRGALGEFLAASSAADSQDAQARADAAAELALLYVDPPARVRDPELALSIALSAITELRPTPKALFALYRAWREGYRGVVYGSLWEGVTDIAWSPAGDRFAAALGDGTIEVLSAQGHRLHSIQSDVAYCLAWSPEGSRLISGHSENTVRSWSATGDMLHEATGTGEYVRRVAWSTDGTRYVSVAVDGSIQVWSNDGRPLSPPTNYGTSISDLSWSADTTMFVVAGDSGVLQVHSSEGRVMHSFAANDEHITRVAFAPSGSSLAAASSDDIVRIWSADGTLQSELIGHSGSIWDVSWSPDGGTLATASFDNTARLWATDGTTLQTLAGHTNPVNDVEWSPDGTKIATAANDATVRLWSAQGLPLNEFSGHRHSVNKVRWSPDGKTLVSSSGDDTVRLWSGDAPASLSLTGHTRAVFDVAWSPDGLLIASASVDGTARLWSAKGESLQILSGHTNTIKTVTWSPDGSRLASASFDHTARVWSKDGDLLFSITDHSGTVENMLWSPGGDRLASYSADGTIRLWSADGHPLNVLPGHEFGVDWAQWSPDGSVLASGGHDHTVRLWSADGALLRNLGEHKSRVECLAWSPTGERLATASFDGATRIWAADGELIHEIADSGLMSRDVAWSPDASMLATASWNGQAHVFSAAGERLYDLVARTIAWSPDGTRIASSAKDSLVRVWASDGRAIFELAGHTDTVRKVAWSPDGTRLASAAEDNTIRIWLEPLDADKLLEHVSRIPGRQKLSMQQRRAASLPFGEAG